MTFPGDVKAYSCLGHRILSVGQIGDVRESTASPVGPLTGVKAVHNLLGLDQDSVLVGEAISRLRARGSDSEKENRG